MGIYDRSYYREDEGGGRFGGRSMVVNIVLFTVACYVAELLFKAPAGDPESLLEKWFALSPDLITHPWRIYQLLTYGFLHAPNNVFHVFWNMLFLWFFGREVEGIYGSLEFLRIYLTLIVMSGLVWFLSTLAGAPGGAGLEGASGAVMGVAMIFTLHFPTRLIYIWGVLPVPMWALMLMYIVIDLMGTTQHEHGYSVAHVAHLAGALFGFIYFRSGWNLGRMVPARLSDLLRPRLKLHDPDPPPRDLSREVDAILEKISRQGEASLTRAERRTLEEASRRYQRRRQ